jgi:RHS repeat-associated protein
VWSPITGTTRFLYDGDRLAIEYNGAGNVLRSYDHGAGPDEPLVWYEAVSGGTSGRYLHADHQGSIIAVADQNGNPIAVNAYDEWGIPNAGNLGRFGYTGQAWLPELGMWYYKARLYSPTLGRFLQTDPVGYNSQINLYGYVENDPLNLRDSNGLCAEDACIGEGLVAACVASTGCEAAVAGFVAGVVYYGGKALGAAASMMSGPDDDIPASDRRVSSNHNGGPPSEPRMVAVPLPGGKGFVDSTGRVRTPETGGPGAGRRISPGTREAERETSGNQCIYCGRPTTNVPDRPNSSEGDHINPANPRGGGARGNNSPENTGNACRTCNRSKNNEGWLKWMKRIFWDE